MNTPREPDIGETTVPLPEPPVSWSVVLREEGRYPPTRLTFAPGVREVRAIGAAYRELIGNFDVAMTAVQVAALIEDRAKVEIEVTAVVPDRDAGNAI